MGLEVGELFGLVAKFGMNIACCGLETPFDKVHHLRDTFLEGCHDLFVYEGSPSLGCVDAISNSLECSHVSPMLSQPLFSHEHSFDMPNDISKLCDFNVSLSNEENVVNMLGGNVETFESLG